MKRTLLLSVLSAALLITDQAHAQLQKVTGAIPKVTLGLKVGANMQQLTGDAFENSYKTGILGGAFLSVRKNKVGVRVEALVKSAKFDVNGSSGYVKTVGLDIPVLFEYKLINRLWLQVGPQFSSIMTAKDDNKNDVKKYFNTSDISGVAGLELMLPLHLTASARYILGFSNLNNNTTFLGNSTINNRGIQIALGFRIL